MTDDSIALLGCAIALLVSAGFLAVSLPLGRLFRGSSSATHEHRTVAFRIPEPAAESDERKAA